MTAFEFLNQNITISHFYSKEEDNMLCFSGDLEKAMIEFAKYHVEQALREASEKATAGQEFVDMGGEFEDIPIYEAYIMKDSILDAYPLDLIV